MAYSKSIIALGFSFAFLCPPPVLGQSTATPVWVKHAWTNESAYSIRPYAIAAGEAIYVTGHAHLYPSGASFDGTTLTSDSSFAFLVRYDPNGTQRWVRSGVLPRPEAGFGSLHSGFALALARDTIYTSEGFLWTPDRGMLTAGGVALTTYTDSGVAHRSTVIGASYQLPWQWPGFVKGLGRDAAGHLYVAGEFRDTLLLGPDTLVSAPSYFDGSPSTDLFLASFDAQGTLRWSEPIFGPGTEWLIERLSPVGNFAVDEAGTVYVGGKFEEGAVFGANQPGETTLPHDAVGIARYDANGTLVDVRTAADLHVSGDVGLHQVTVDSKANLYAAWRIVGGETTVVVGDTTFSGTNDSRGFLTKYDETGGLLWARQLISHLGGVQIRALTIDAEGNLYVAGIFSGLTLLLENTVLRKDDLQADGTDGFVAWYSPEGHLLGALHVAGQETQRVNAIAVDPGGNLYVAGEFKGTMRLGSEELSTHSWIDLFVAKYDAATITTTASAPELPAGATLAPNYPNPFHTHTTIRYTLTQPGPTRLVVYDVLGHTVATLVDAPQPTGTHEVVFDAEALPSGVYVYRLETAGQHLSRTMLLAK